MRRAGRDRRGSQTTFGRRYGGTPDEAARLVNQRSEPTSGGLASPSPRRLLIVRMSAMGDIIHAMPAASALRKAWPEATIGWLVEERWAELLSSARSLGRAGCGEGRPLVDRIHIVDTRRWRRAVLSR